MSEGRSETGGRELRVAVLTRYFPPDYSGAGLQLATVIDTVQRRGVRFSILAAGEPDAGSTRGSAVVERFRHPGGGPLGQVLFGVRVAARLLRDRDWDVLHMIDFSFSSLAPWLVARILRRPILVKTTLLEAPGTGPGARLLRAIRGFGYRRADALVALSDALEESLRSDFGVRGPILRIPNGVDTERFHPADPKTRSRLRQAGGLPENAFVVALCGMRIPRKNALDLVAAVARLRHRPVLLLLVGPPGNDTEYERRLRTAIAALPEGVSARIVDDTPPDGIARLLRCADAYVLPSRGEGMPNSLLEGMAAGLACIATDIPGSRDLLISGAGRLVPLDDVDALAEALDAVAADPASRAELGRRALERVQADYTLERVAERYAAAYAKLLE